MGNLMKSGISYSGTGTGVLMLNGINYTGAGGGSGEAMQITISVNKPTNSETIGFTITDESNQTLYSETISCSVYGEFNKKTINFTADGKSVSMQISGTRVQGSDTTPFFIVEYDGWQMGFVTDGTNSSYSCIKSQQAYIYGSSGGGDTMPCLMSSGYQSIQLPIYDNGEYTFKFKLFMCGAQSNTLILGGYWNEGALLFHTFYLGNDYVLYYYIDTTPTPIPMKIGEWMDIELAPSYIKVDGITYSGTFTQKYANPTCLFGLGSAYCSSIAMSEMKIYDSNNDLVMDLEPRKDNDGYGYYYDKVGDDNYYSSTAPLAYSEMTIVEGIPAQLQFEYAFENSWKLYDSNGLSGTDVIEPVLSFTADGDVTFKYNGVRIYTNTGSNEGFFALRKNGTIVYKQNLTTNATAQYTNIPSIDLETGDTVEFCIGFDGVHSGCMFTIYELT